MNIKFSTCSILSCLLPAVRGHGQLISTIAGTGTQGYAGDGGQATAAKLLTPNDAIMDGAGNLYISDAGNNCVRKVSSGGIITTIAGTGVSGYNGDGIPATAAQLSGVGGVSFDHTGNVYINDCGNYRIRKITIATGIITTIAGTGAGSFGGDGGLATAAEINSSGRIIFDTAGNIYIADMLNERIRKIYAATGMISTIAGTGTAGYNGDNIPAANATLHSPAALVLDDTGNIYIADNQNSRVRKISAATGIITTIAGDGLLGYNGDGIPATDAYVPRPGGLAIDNAGTLYIGEETGARVRRVNLINEIISTVAGDGTLGYNGDGIQATNAELYLPAGITVDDTDNLYIADNQNQRIRKVPLGCDTVSPAVTISTSSMYIDSGQAVTFSATVSNGGNSPGYQWQDNQLYIQGATNSTYTTSVLTSSDTITCHVHSSKVCAYPDSSISNKIAVHVHTTGLSGTPQTNISLYPNPATCGITIFNAGGSYVLYTIDGILLQSSIFSSDRETLDIRSLPAGVYLLRILPADGSAITKKIVKEQ